MHCVPNNHARSKLETGPTSDVSSRRRTSFPATRPRVLGKKVDWIHFGFLDFLWTMTRSVREERVMESKSFVRENLPCEDEVWPLSPRPVQG